MLEKRKQGPFPKILLRGWGWKEKLQLKSNAVKNFFKLLMYKKEIIKKVRYFQKNTVELPVPIITRQAKRNKLAKEFQHVQVKRKNALKLIYWRRKKIIKTIKRQFKRQRITMRHFKKFYPPKGIAFFNSLRLKKMVWSDSNGGIGFHGPKRQLPYASSKLGLKAGRYVRKKKFHDCAVVIILRSKLSMQIRNFINGFNIVRPNIGVILPKYRLPHNSIRQKKFRRV